MKKDGVSVSLQSIALKTGFSVPTVIQVLGTRGHLYKESTRERVLKVANELGYRPKYLCPGDAQRPVQRDWAAAEHGLQSQPPPGRPAGRHSGGLARGDMHLSLSPVPDEKLTSIEIPKIVRQQMVDGLLINYTDHIPAPLIDLIAEHRIPSIWLNTRSEEDAIRPDDYGAARKATDVLLELGHRHITYVDYHNSRSDTASHYSARDRYLGYADAMQAAALEPRTIWENEAIKPKDRIAHASRWLQKPDRPTAVVCYSPWTALPVMLAATATTHLRVPDDLSIITFSDQVFEDIGVSMTTMLLPEHELGKQAVEMLLEKIEQPRLKLPTRVLPFILNAATRSRR